MVSVSSFNRAVRHLLCVIDVFTKYFWVNTLKDKWARTVLHGFIEIVNESKHKINKLWVYEEKEFYNSLMQKWLDDNDNLMSSTHIEGKWIVAERFRRTFEG